MDKSTRETVWAWTDASGDGGGFAAVENSAGTRYYTALVVPDSVTNQLLHREDAQINFLEMLAVVLLVETFVDLLSCNAVFCFIDNSGVLASLTKGSCRAPETNMLIGRLWLLAAQHSWVPFWAQYCRWSFA